MISNNHSGEELLTGRYVIWLNGDQQGIIRLCERVCAYIHVNHRWRENAAIVK